MPDSGNTSTAENPETAEKNPGKKGTDPEKLTLEQSFALLEDITKALEDPKTTLEDSFVLYEEGMQLLRAAEKKIDLVEKKVLELSDRIVAESHLTTLMITHNMRDALRCGNRLIMMYDGKILIDVKGEEKKNLTVEMLMDAFAKASGEAFANDRILLS